MVYLYILPRPPIVIFELNIQPPRSTYATPTRGDSGACGVCMKYAVRRTAAITTYYIITDEQRTMVDRIMGAIGSFASDPHLQLMAYDSMFAGASYIQFT